jgi:hypothetical protein
VYKFIPVFLIVSASTSCGLKHQVAPTAVKTSEIALTTGEAYDSLRLRTTNQRCISFTEEVQGGLAERTGFIRKIDDARETSRNIGFELSGSFTYGLAKGDSKAKLVEEGKSSERSVGFIAYTKIITKASRAMSPALLEVYNRERCGDSYVANLYYGAEMSVLVKMAFSTSKMLRKFDASGGGTYGSLAEIKASVSSLDEDSKKHSSISIQYSATGEALNDVRLIFSGRDVVTCSLENFDRCETLLSSIIDYENGAFAQNATHSNSVIAFDLAPYPGNSQVQDPSLEAKREHLALMIEDTELDLERAKTLTESSMLPPAEVEAIDLIRNKISFNLGKLKDSVVTCFDSPELCNESPALRTYDRDTLKHRTVERNVVFSANTSGVIGCAESLTLLENSTCEAKGVDMPGDLESYTTSGGIESSTYRTTIFVGRSCEAAIDNAICHLQIRL